MTTLDALQFALSPQGQEILETLAKDPITPNNHLQIATKLRKSVDPPLAQALIEIALLRQLGTVKFSKSSEMYFTRPALEQATAEPVAAYRAQRFKHFGAQHIGDLGCSIGGDAIALAQQAMVTGVDWDLVRLSMAQENLRVYGRSANFSPLQADLLSLTPQPFDALFFDPARRDERGRRFFSVHEYQPPLSVVDQWRKMVPETAVKVSPGIDYAELPEDAEIEFVSYKGEVKEGVLWYGQLQTGVARRATCLPGNHTLTTDDQTETIPTAPLKAFLYEPDGAVIRAHLVEGLATQLNATKIDDEIAYLSSDTAVDSPFATRYQIEDVMPFHLKRLRHYLQEHKIGQVTLKKRGSPLDLDKLKRQLRLNSAFQQNHKYIFLTQIQGNPSIIIGQKN